MPSKFHVATLASGTQLEEEEKKKRRNACLARYRGKMSASSKTIWVSFRGGLVETNKTLLVVRVSIPIPVK